MYSRAVILISFAAFAAGQSTSIISRIIGGVDVDIIHHPYQISLREAGKHYCGGAVIGKRHILTAAHCVDTRPVKDITVVSGTNFSSGQDGTVHRVSKAVHHDEWTRDKEAGFKNDIAVITLTADINTDEAHTKIIYLPRGQSYSGEEGMISGWGGDRYGTDKPSPTLKEARMSMLLKDSCQPFYTVKLSLGHVCASHEQGVGGCSGDSGGPLVVRDEIVGIASWVAQPCGLGKPDVFTYVYHYKDWIQSKMTDF